MRFLIDECLSPLLVSVAAEAGYEAYHVAHIGMARWTDRDVTRHAIDGDFVLVTNNAADYRRLYAELSLHAGLIIMIPALNRREQMQLFRDALIELGRFGEPVNHVLEVDIKDQQITFTIYELPTPST